MTGRRDNDICYSTIKGRLARTFNTDGLSRDVITKEEAFKPFDFKIEKRQSYDFNRRKIPGHYHLVRSDTDDIIPSASVGEKFHPYDHSEVLKYVYESILSRFPQMSLETVGTLHGGGTGLITARVGEPFAIKDDVSKCFVRMVISNPCNGCGSLIIGFVIVREDCQNCIMVAESKAESIGIQIHHTRNVDSYVSKVIANVGKYLTAAEKTKQTIERMAETKYDERMFKRILEMFLPLPGEYGSRGYNKTLAERNEVIAQLTGAETAMQIAGDSLWKMFNSFAFPIFNPRRYTNSMDAMEIAYLGMVGDRIKTSTEIFNAIAEMAENDNASKGKRA